MCFTCNLAQWKNETDSLSLTKLIFPSLLSTILQYLKNQSSMEGDSIDIKVYFADEKYQVNQAMIYWAKSIGKSMDINFSGWSPGTMLTIIKGSPQWKSLEKTIDVFPRCKCMRYLLTLILLLLQSSQSLAMDRVPWIRNQLSLDGDALPFHKLLLYLHPSFYS